MMKRIAQARDWVHANSEEMVFIAIVLFAAIGVVDVVMMLI